MNLQEGTVCDMPSPESLTMLSCATKRKACGHGNCVAADVTNILRTRSERSLSFPGVRGEVRDIQCTPV